MTNNDFESLGGKVISLVGAPGTGKTFLAKKLEEHLNALVILEEGDDGFPEKIQRNLAKQEDLFETILWFRNKQVNDFLAAKKLASNATVPIIVETPYYQNQLFVELYVKDSFKKQILFECGNLDFSMYGEPDVTLYLKSTRESVRSFLALREGERSWEDREWVEFISKMPPMVDQLMKRVDHKNVLEFDRAKYDFAKKKHLEELLSILKHHLTM